RAFPDARGCHLERFDAPLRYAPTECSLATRACSARSEGSIRHRNWGPTESTADPFGVVASDRSCIVAGSRITTAGEIRSALFAGLASDGVRRVCRFQLRCGGRSCRKIATKRGGASGNPGAPECAGEDFRTE